ncbi:MULTISPECIES: Mur ligase family protein [unclassified Sinorhizobium]|uniref:Mur ligase family protein n=1 Tax=unclassified Sinorhizobium TaxID=2613772 RepID=UPI0024C32BB3|nr:MULTISPECIES: Mur ligase family protein [unclassified Sinorhizobium]MDK1378150.1 Mur ligase family protein [Sinorhizobium sp. 6-70]MDK1479801.1 Mur ligase family protein [Sinorhizobium sp. 6-117]
MGNSVYNRESRFSVEHLHVLIDGVNEDAVALAQHLSRRGKRVTVLHTEYGDPENARRALRAEGGNVDFRLRTEIANIGEAGTLFVSPSTPSHDVIIDHARAKGFTISSLADTVLRDAPGGTVGVTGSAGKTTTTFLLSAILRNAGFDVIGSTDYRLTPSGPGKAMLEAVTSLNDASWAVVELTSHHLSYVTTSPSIGVVTNLFPDHQDWHGSFEAYRSAKQNLLRFQQSGDVAVLNFDDPEVRGHFHGLGRGRNFYFSAMDKIANGIVVADGHIALRSRGGCHKICAVSELRMPRHHIPNALAAAAVAIELGVKTETLRDALVIFQGLPQRCQFLGIRDGIEIYDDTIGMNPRKALNGLETFPDQSLVVVSGGAVQSVGGEKRVNSALEMGDLRLFCEALLRKATSVVLFDEGGDIIERTLAETGGMMPPVVRAKNFEAAVLEAIGAAHPGARLLISPVFYNPPLDVRRFLEHLVSKSG